MLARFFIDRPVLAWVISIVIVLLGAISAGFLPVAEYPEITPPTVRVTASYPGSDARVVADTVAAPIEQQVVGVEGMMYMSSQSNYDGSYTLDVTFELGTNVNMAQVLVQNRVAIAEPTLPDVVQTIGVAVKETDPGQVASGDQPVFRRRPGDRPAVLRFALPEQLRHDPRQRHRRPGWRASATWPSSALQDYGNTLLARPGQAAVAGT